MDVRSAVERAAKRVNTFTQLPFATDAEMADLFGPEVKQALRLLDQLNASQNTCRECAGLCCSQMRCELYAAEFGQCPVSQFRPVLCRFNFCYRFGKDNADLAKALIEVAVDTVAAVPADSPAAGGFALNALLYGECQGPGDILPPAVLRMRTMTDEARSGRLSWEEARRSLVAEVERYRSRIISSSGSPGAPS